MWRLYFACSLVAIALLTGASLAEEAQFAQGPLRRGEQGFRALYTIGRDGSRAQYLVAAPGMISSATPAWSHDGKMVAFDGVPALDEVTQSQIFAYALEGPFKGPVRNLGYGNTPSWSPDDRQIAFMLNDRNPIGAAGGIWLMNADGSGRRWFNEGWYPRWSPDGKRLCCHAWLKDGTDSLFVVDYPEGTRRSVFGSPRMTLCNYGGTWSPDGKSIVFIGAWDSKEHLAIVKVDEHPGTGIGGGSKPDEPLRSLYTSDEPGGELFGPPAWSPDGRQIVSGIQLRGGGPRQWWKSYLYSIAADIRSAPVLLEPRLTGNINRGMAWSPDSKQVVFSSER